MNAENFGQRLPMSLKRSIADDSGLSILKSNASNVIAIATTASLKKTRRSSSKFFSFDMDRVDAFTQGKLTGH